MGLRLDEKVKTSSQGTLIYTSQISWLIAYYSKRECSDDQLTLTNVGDWRDSRRLFKVIMTLIFALWDRQFVDKLYTNDVFCYVRLSGFPIYFLPNRLKAYDRMTLRFVHTKWQLNTKQQTNKLPLSRVLYLWRHCHESLFLLNCHIILSYLNQTRTEEWSGSGAEVVLTCLIISMRNDFELSKVIYHEESPFVELMAR